MGLNDDLLGEYDGAPTSGLAQAILSWWDVDSCGRRGEKR